MSGTSPDSVSYPTQNYGVLGPLPAYVINLQDVPGADPTGNDDSTIAINTALASLPDDGGELIIAPGIYTFSAPLVAKSNTVISGPGVLKAAPIERWQGSPYYGITNVNNEASVITDSNITISGITIDYTDLPSADGTRHCIYLRKVRKVKIAGVTILQGSSSVALLGCDDTEEIGNTYKGFTNCGSDHWDSPSNGRLIGCHIESGDGFAVNQMVNWNPDGTLTTDPGQLAENFTMVGNTIVSFESAATPCQIEPLRTGGVVRNVVVEGNVFVNSYLALRADTSGVVVANNTFSDFQGTGEAITSYPRVGGNPGAILVRGNVIRDPLTSAGSVGVIRIESPQAQIFENTILGTGYLAPPIYTGNTTVGQIFGNYAEMTQIAGRLQKGMILEGGSGNFYGWSDGGGTFPRMYQQTSDNNWIFQGTDSTGAPRIIGSIVMRSDTSDMRWSVPTVFVEAMRYNPVEFAAAGTTLAGATALTANVCRVTSATVPTASGVRLSPTNGRPQIVYNETDDVIYVWPNTTTVPVDGGEPGFPVTLQAGQARAFILFTDSQEFRSYAMAENAVDLTVEDVSAQLADGATIDLTTVPAVEPPTYNINHHILYGQSLSIGSEGSPVLSTTPKYENVMFGDGVRPITNNTPTDVWDIRGSPAFNPLDASGDGAEVALHGALNTYRMLDFRSRQVTSDATYVHCASSAGIGGQSIAQLSKGAVPDIYNRLLECMDQANTQAGVETLTYGVSSMVFMQGESDQTTSKATYKTALETLIADFQADAIAETGQTLPPAIFMYQTTARNGNYNTTSLGVQMAQLEVALADDTVFMVGPVYPTNDSGNLHLPANGYRHWGSQLGKVMHRVFTLGQRWKPLHITGGTIKGRRVLLTYDVPFPPLVIDQPWLQTGWYPTDPTTGAANSPFDSADLGFTVKTTTGVVQDIASVVLVGENQVLITLANDTDVATYNYECWYADGLDSHVGHGCIRDSDPAVADDFYKDLQSGQAADERNYLYSGKRYPLWNWAVAQVVSLTEV